MAITLAHHNDIIICVLRMTELFLQFRRLLKLPNVSVHERVLKCFKSELINGKNIFKNERFFYGKKIIFEDQVSQVLLMNK